MAERAGEQAKRKTVPVHVHVYVYVYVYREVGDSAVMERVLAHITGTVWKVLVQVGDSVGADQELLILESMKMEMPVEAPSAGRVASIAVTPGQAVEEGDLLLELE